MAIFSDGKAARTGSALVLVPAPTFGTTNRQSPFLFGDLAKGMREVEFIHSTDARGLISFRVNLPLEYGTKFAVAAADGQMGCLIKVYREWQLSGDDIILARGLATVPKGAGVLLDSRRLGCRSRRRDGRVPAQHHGCGVLRTESANGFSLSVCSSMRRRNGEASR